MFEELKRFARRLGEQDRIAWRGTHDKSPEDYFVGADDAMMSEIEGYTFAAIDRMSHKCRMAGYDPSSKEKELLTFEHIAAFYLSKLFATIYADFSALEGSMPFDDLLTLIRSDLEGMNLDANAINRKAPDVPQDRTP